MFVPPASARGLLSGDIVSARFKDTHKGRELVEVLDIARQHESISGIVLSSTKGRSTIKLDPQRTRMIVHHDQPLPVGSWVVGDLSVDKGFTLTDTFSEASTGTFQAIALAATGFPNSAPVLEDGFEVLDSVAEREDLRHLPTFTIDGPTSLDLDDAISVQMKDDQYVVYVHIADVAEQVLPGSSLDMEAATWCTSVYLEGWNRPMLPRELSENALSLLPGQDRATLTVKFVVSPAGEVSNVELVESLIRSDYRYTYEEAAEYLQEDCSGLHVPDAVRESLGDAGSVAVILRSNRRELPKLSLIHI